MSEAPDVELRKEAYVMALYVAVCLLAALVALGEDAGHGHVRAFGLVWGTTIGLALAHAFAFRVSARLVGSGEVSPHDAQIVAAQLAGATAVAALSTLPLVVFGATVEFDVVRTVLAVIVGATGFAIGRESGASWSRSALTGIVVLALAVAVALVKNVISGH